MFFSSANSYTKQHGETLKTILKVTQTLLIHYMSDSLLSILLEDCGCSLISFCFSAYFPNFAVNVYCF